MTLGGYSEILKNTKYKRKVNTNYVNTNLFYCNLSMSQN